MSTPTLRELAKRATPGPWYNDHDKRTVLAKGYVGQASLIVASASLTHNPKEPTANMELIARLSPDVALKVYEVLEKAIWANIVGGHDGVRPTMTQPEIIEEMSRGIKEALVLLDGKAP